MRLLKTQKNVSTTALSLSVSNCSQPVSISGFAPWLAAALLAAILVGSMTQVTAVNAEAVDLYEYHALVSTQTRPERNKATKAGLAEIIVRASGQSSVLSNAGVKNALRNPSRYLLEYRYQSTDKTLEVDNEIVPAYDLVLKFSDSSVEKLLREQQLPIWPANRPSVLVWLVVDEGNRKSLVSDDYLPEGNDTIFASGTQRGLPVVLPQGDVNELSSSAARKMWQLDELSIRRSSERYDTDSILVGRLTKTSQTRWRASWLLINKNGSKTFDSSGADLQKVIAGGIGQTADHFFKLYGYAPTGGSQSTFLFSVDGVTTFGDYAMMMKYLEGITVVRNIDLVAAENDNILMRVSTEVSLNALEQAIALDNRLVKSYSSNSGGVVSGAVGVDSNPTYYSWRN